MFDIKQLIQARCENPFPDLIDPWEDDLVKEALDYGFAVEAAFVLSGSALRHKWKSYTVLDKYKIIGVYNLGPIFTTTNAPFYIIQLSKHPSLGLKTAFFKGQCHKERLHRSEERELLVPEQYTEEWEKYASLLEDWMNGAAKPESTDQFEFNFVPSDQVMEENLFPENYSNELVELRGLMKNQETRALSELADIISPVSVHNSDDSVKLLKLHDLVYPFDISCLQMGKPTTVILQKGDIVVPKHKGRVKAYLFNYDGNERVYASSTLFVVKCRAVLPEFLYLYLNSETSAKILTGQYIGGGMQLLPTRNLASFPVILPTLSEEKYISDFRTLTKFGVRDYEQLQSFTEYAKHLEDIEKHKAKPKDAEDILNVELANKIKAYREEQLRIFLTEDLRELNTCFKHKAYKAAMILAGSILEAVLIDWLSEIKQEDYFKKQYYVPDGKGKMKKADLYDYIDEIKILKHPKWEQAAKKAHKIRKKRNLVHAKLCIDSNEINEQKCKDVINYLEEVLKTRGAISAAK